MIFYYFTFWTLLEKHFEIVFKFSWAYHWDFFNLWQTLCHDQNWTKLARFMIALTMTAFLNLWRVDLKTQWLLNFCPSTSQINAFWNDFWEGWFVFVFRFKVNWHSFLKVVRDSWSFCSCLSFECFGYFLLFVFWQAMK